MPKMADPTAWTVGPGSAGTILDLNSRVMHAFDARAAGPRGVLGVSKSPVPKRHGPKPQVASCEAFDCGLYPRTSRAVAWERGCRIPKANFALPWARCAGPNGPKGARAPGPGALPAAPPEVGAEG